jgi:hypothetical protein
VDVHDFPSDAVGKAISYGVYDLAASEDFGHPKLREHLAAVLMIMKYAPSWQIFWQRLDAEFPQWGDTLMLPFPEDYDPPNVTSQVTNATGSSSSARSASG